MESSDQRTVKDIIFRLTDQRKPPQEDGFQDKGGKGGEAMQSWGLELGWERRGVSRGNSMHREKTG